MITYNTVERLSSKTIKSLHGLNIGLVQTSQDSTGSMYDVSTVVNLDTEYNKISKLNKPIDSYDGLLADILESSKDKTKVRTQGLKLKKPIKTYMMKLEY